MSAKTQSSHTKSLDNLESAVSVLIRTDLDLSLGSGHSRSGNAAPRIATIGPRRYSHRCTFSRSRPSGLCYSSPSSSPSAAAAEDTDGGGSSLSRNEADGARRPPSPSAKQRSSSSHSANSRPCTGDCSASGGLRSSRAYQYQSTATHHSLNESRRAGQPERQPGPRPELRLRRLVSSEVISTDLERSRPISRQLAPLPPRARAASSRCRSRGRAAARRPEGPLTD